MLAILGGLGAALAWAGSTLCSSRSSRAIPPASVVAWVALSGLAVTAPVALAGAVPSRLGGADGAWLVLAGAGNIAGLLVAYLAYRSGDVALVAPLIASEGAIAAVIAIAAGERIDAPTALTLAVIAGGITLAASHRDPAAHLAGHGLRVIAPAFAAALCFGVSLYATGRVSGRLPLPWVVLSARLLGSVFVALPLALRGRLRLTRRTLPLVLAAGMCEVLGYAVYTVGARHGIAITAVLSCQFAGISALVGYVLFGERLARTQVAGVLVLLAGVSALSLLRA